MVNCRMLIPVNCAREKYSHNLDGLWDISKELVAFYSTTSSF